MRETIAKLVQDVSIFSIEVKGNVVHEYFEANKEVEGIVIADVDKPVGLLMRTDFYQKVGRQFGYSLYMNRNIQLIMKSHIVCVDISCDMAKIGFIAMNRSKDDLYDFIVVLEDDKCAGVVSIRELLIEMSKTKEREIELLSKQQLILKKANEVEKIHSMEIEQKNSSIKNLLNNAGQGFLLFGKDLNIYPEYSRECIEIFGNKIENKNILDMLALSMEDENIQIMRDVFSNVFNEPSKAKNKIYLSVLPQIIKINKKSIEIQWKVINNLSQKSIMIILTDITEKEILENKNIEEKNNVKLIIETIKHKEEVNSAFENLKKFFTDGAYEIINGCNDKKQILYEIYRIVHTMKGDFALYSVHNTSKRLHKLEDRLSVMLDNMENVNIYDIVEFVKNVNGDKIISKDIKTIDSSLGDGYFEKEDLIAVSEERLNDIEEEIKRKYQGKDQKDMLVIINNLKFTNVKHIIGSYNDYTKSMAEKLDKVIDDFKIYGDDVYIDKKRYTKFIRSLVHIFKNIIDHGIEEPDARIYAGKAEYGEISCYIEKAEGKFIMNISDDGNGIDYEIIREKAIEKGIYSRNEIDTFTQEEILEIIFMDKFSTKNQVSMLSGRGVGLAAVRGEIENIGGTVKMYTQKGKFTRFEFVVPMIE
ncbi:ATP-binding protein [Clostridium akagii]|uniref:ATP-binding protein n=1 Tax=Clostridium akagii TaxID=91623 RepID=UPI00047D1CD1|nr:ATP-binding protein [Clostridium akagii]